MASFIMQVTTENNAAKNDETYITQNKPVDDNLETNHSLKQRTQVSLHVVRMFTRIQCPQIVQYQLQFAYQIPILLENQKQRQHIDNSIKIFRLFTNYHVHSNRKHKIIH